MGTSRSLTQISAAEKRTRVVQLRGEGYTFATIARMVGYSDSSHAARAFREAIRQLPARDLDDIRADSMTRLEQAMETLADVINNPPPITSAAGKVVTDANGNPVADKSAVTRATAELRKCDESYRKLTGADQPPKKAISRDEAWRRAEEWVADLTRKHAELTRAQTTRDDDDQASTWSPW